MIEEIYILRGTNRKELKDIITRAGSNNIDMTELQKGEIDKICRTSKHQGVAARIKEFAYTDFSRIVSKPGNNKSCSVIVILDHIEDPHNFGAVLRTSGFFNVDGVVIPRDRAVPVTPAVIKVSAGAVSTVPASQWRPGRLMTPGRAKGAGPPARAARLPGLRRCYMHSSISSRDGRSSMVRLRLNGTEMSRQVAYSSR
jgi:tRNA G18 (ribose-2'-O)-methylase SpoU